MSAPGGAPSPAPRSGSMGPNGGGMPISSQPPLSGTPVHPASTPGPSQPQSGAMSQQNLNQIVSAFLYCIVSLRCPAPVLRRGHEHGGNG